MMLRHSCSFRPRSASPFRPACIDASSCKLLRPKNSRSSVRVHGLLEGLRSALKGNTKHAPELVRIDMNSDGGLGGTSEHLFGPLAVAMIGYHPREVDTFRAFMNDMDADMVKLICCTSQQMKQSLQQVLEAPTPDVKEPAAGVRRAVFLSGMSGEEVSEVIGAYNDSGLPETVWAAAVPMNYDRRIEDLVHDIYGDHIEIIQKLHHDESKKLSIIGMTYAKLNEDCKEDLVKIFLEQDLLYIREQKFA